MFIHQSKSLHWTYHARAKMAFYKLSEQRVRRVLNSPKRVEEGIAPKTTAMMQPAFVKRVKGHGSRDWQETWNQEIWVMIQEARTDADRTRTNAENKKGLRMSAFSQRGSAITKIISAWRYPGKTKPRSEAAKEVIMSAYKAYMASAEK